MSEGIAVYVLDSYAAIAYLEGETGMERVREVLLHSAEGRCRALMSLINLGEILYITEREYGLPKAQAVLAAIEQLPLEILAASREAVFNTAHLKAHYRIAYADAFAIAAAQEHGGTILTGDPEFSCVEEIVKVEWLSLY